MKKEIFIPVLIAFAIAIISPAQLFGQNSKAGKKEKTEKADTLRMIRHGNEAAPAIPATPAEPARRDNTRVAPAVPAVPATPDNTRAVPAQPAVPATPETHDKAAPADRVVPERSRTTVPPGQVDKSSDDRVKGYEKTSETGRKEGWSKDRDVRTNERIPISQKEHRKAVRKAEKKRAKELRKSEQQRLKALQKSRSDSDKR